MATTTSSEFITLRRDALPELAQEIIRRHDCTPYSPGERRKVIGEAVTAAIIAAGVEVPERAIDPKFSIRGGEIVKVSSGEVLPEWEPLILMRARDHLLLPVLQHYRKLSELDGCNDYHLSLLDERIAEFQRFKDDHPEWMKQPGITRGAAFVPSTPPLPASAGTERCARCGLPNEPTKPPHKIPAILARRGGCHECYAPDPLRGIHPHVPRCHPFVPPAPVAEKCGKCGEEKTVRGGDVHCSGDCDDAFHDEPDGCHQFVPPAEPEREACCSNHDGGPPCANSMNPCCAQCPEAPPVAQATEPPPSPAAPPVSESAGRAGCPNCGEEMSHLLVPGGVNPHWIRRSRLAGSWACSPAPVLRSSTNQQENAMSTHYEFWQMAPFVDGSHLVSPDNPQFTDEMRSKSAQEVAKRFGDGHYMLVRRTDGGSIEMVSEFTVSTTRETKVVGR